jgi:hypothetical protein
LPIFGGKKIGLFLKNQYQDPIFGTIKQCFKSKTPVFAIFFGGNILTRAGICSVVEQSLKVIKFQKCKNVKLHTSIV